MIQVSKITMTKKYEVAKRKRKSRSRVRVFFGDGCVVYSADRQASLVRAKNKKRTDKLAEAQLSEVDQKIVKYLAKLGLGNPEHFATFKMDGLHWATGYYFTDEFLQERLDHLVRIGRITSAVKYVGRKEFRGYICLSERWFNPRFDISDEDREFLREIRIAVPETPNYKKATPLGKKDTLRQLPIDIGPDGKCRLRPKSHGKTKGHDA